MSIFGGNPAMKAGNHAYRCHVDGNKLIEAGKEKEGQAKLDEALKYYAEAYEAGLDRVGMLMSYGVLLMRRGEYEKAKEVYLRVHYKPGLSKDDRFDLRNNYSICLWRLGKLDEAIATIKRAAADNKTTLVYTTLGLFLILKADQSGDFSEAIAFKDEAYDAGLDRVGMLMSYGGLLMRRGEYEKAKEVYLRVHYKPGLSKDDRFDLRNNYSI